MENMSTSGPWDRFIFEQCSRAAWPPVFFFWPPQHFAIPNRSDRRCRRVPCCRDIFAVDSPLWCFWPAGVKTVEFAVCLFWPQGSRLRGFFAVASPRCLFWAARCKILFSTTSDHCNHGNHSNNHKSNQLSVHQWHRSAIRESQQPTSPIGFLFWNFRHRLVRSYWYPITHPKVSQSWLEGIKLMLGSFAPPTIQALRIGSTRFT